MAERAQPSIPPTAVPSWVMVVLVLLLIWLQFQLWLAPEGVRHRYQLSRDIKAQEIENVGLRERNNVLMAEVTDLKTGLDAIEERARQDLGLIGEGEIFYRVVNDQPAGR